MGANYVRDFVVPRRDERALVVHGQRDWTFAELDARSANLAARFVDRGVARGGVVLTLVGNTIEYPLIMLACLRIGAPMLPASEQLRARDLRLRLDRAHPALIVADERNRDVVETAAPECPVLFVPDASLVADVETVPDFADLADTDPAFVLFTSGTSGAPKLVTHGQRFVWGQRRQAQYWLGAEPGELVWSTAAPGWSKSTRNTFIAPWFCGAAALLQDRRFAAAERLATLRDEQIDVLCMAPTEYRLIAAAGPIGALPSLRRAVTAGEPLGVPAFTAWREQTGIEIADGYGQTETGHVTGVRPGETAPLGSMGRPLPGVRVAVVDGELTVDPGTVPTFFLGYDGSTVPSGMWRTGDQVRQDAEGWLFFTARRDDVIISAGYRIGPAEVESTLGGHAAVAECAALGVPDADRGQVVGAAVVLRAGFTASDHLAAELQAYVREQTAPYKYPRRIWFLDALPKTTSGKIARAQLRAELA